MLCQQQQQQQHAWWGDVMCVRCMYSVSAAELREVVFVGMKTKSVAILAVAARPMSHL
jgi:hypothetical protein